MLLPTDAELEEFAADWLKENFLLSVPSPIATTLITFCKAVLLEFGNRPVEEDDPCALHSVGGGGCGGRRGRGGAGRVPLGGRRQVSRFAKGAQTIFRVVTS